VPSGTALRALSLQITSGQSSGSYLTCNTIIGDTRLIVPESAKDTSWLYCFAPISGSFVPGLYYQLDDGETFSPAVVQFQVGSTLVFGAQMTGTSYGSVVLDFERVPNSSTSFALYLAFTYGSTPMKAYATEINTGFVTFDSTAKIDAALTLSVTFTA
jgi:hypothetical protein